jgi:copper chaperone CopZ
MVGADSSGSGSSFPKQWLATGIVLVVVAVVALFAISGQMGGSRTSLATDAEQVTTVNSDAVSDAIIAVEGMSCGACAARVKGTLKEIDGVAAVEVSLADRNVRVRYAKEKVTPERLAEAINKLGYKAAVPVQAIIEEPDVDIPAETAANTQGFKAGTPTEEGD